MMLAAEYLSTQRRRNIFVVQGSSVVVGKNKNICKGRCICIFIFFNSNL